MLNLDKNFNKGGNEYLILDDVFQDACYQTSATDLESVEDFKKLRDDCYAIADAYGARNSKDKVKFYYEKDNDEYDDNVDDDDIDKIIEEAKAEGKSGAKSAEPAAEPAAEEKAEEEKPEE